ncbi:uncharacterized protein MELLADRAFT_118370 [Melampsora larici-populina 98AG31]|uniref:histone deacetylase n=1 Tax=Melampsora larici-populina (strain 98AG31 / pathotype 3-4-7) TaxID=747676 RepID=F4S8C1_MELLP|nr:uncharacterized protein MELLADRAFT_118370 [Melampsora larici-populina 98AG31]EGF99116.1 hypothetical protein MELLADRAFT_118370 [Melampsora larici-populina 98AG31]
MSLPTFACLPSFLEFDPSNHSQQKPQPSSSTSEFNESTQPNIGPHSPARVAYYFPKGVGEYHFGKGHPMKPHRLTILNHLVAGYGLHNHMEFHSPRPASREELEVFHSAPYLDFLELNNIRTLPDQKVEGGQSLSLGPHNTGEDCPMFDGIYEFCSKYAGASLMAARKLNSGTSDITINWSGGLHHAKKSEASGFCYVNDIVLAIIELLRIHPRVLYIDIDIHHGDGVQEAFYLSNRVCTVSFHKYNGEFFPGTGTIDEIGYGLGKNFSFNLPLSDGIDNESYINLFRSTIEPIMNCFKPSAIVLQCGADSLGGDRLGGFNISIAAHGECVRFMKSFRIPLLVLGGGGYTPRNVARCWTYETSVLVSDTCPTIPNTLPSTPYDSIFKDEPKLHVNLVTKVDNTNNRKTLETLRIGILERLRYMHGAPSVQMQEIPPGLSDWLESESEMLEKDKERVQDFRRSKSKSTGVLLDYFPNNNQPPPPRRNSRSGSVSLHQFNLHELSSGIKGMPVARTRASYALNSRDVSRRNTIVKEAGANLTGNLNQNQTGDGDGNGGGNKNEKNVDSMDLDL